MTHQKLCIAKLRIVTEPDFGSGVPSKFEKHPIFDVFEFFFAYNTGVSQLIYFKKGAKCVYCQGACNTKRRFFLGGGVRGP